MFVPPSQVLSADLVSEVSLHDIADIHRVRDASLTMLLKVCSVRVWVEVVEKAAGLPPSTSPLPVFRVPRSMRTQHPPPSPLHPCVFIPTPCSRRAPPTVARALGQQLAVPVECACGPRLLTPPASSWALLT